MPPPYPREVRRLPEERRLSIIWSDGLDTVYEYDYLRGYCPCALCQGHTALEIRFYPPTQPVDITAVQPVGNYGLSLAFSDGHGTGIYRFEFLREIASAS